MSLELKPYEISDFQSIEKILKSRIKNTGQKRKTLAIAGADNIATLKAVVRAYEEDLIDFILFGNEEDILQEYKLLEKEEDRSEAFEELLTGKIVNTRSKEESASMAVAAVKSGKADILMKGNLHTKTLLKAVVNKDKGLSSGSVMSSVVFIDSPEYHKLFAITDPGMVMYPDFEEKLAIARNAEILFTSLGYKDIKMAGLAAVEVVNTKMQATIDADKLSQLSKTARLPNTIFEGPLSLDIAMDSAIAAKKGAGGRILSDVDVLLMPSIEAGNILVKALIVFGRSKIAGCVVGASCPIVLTSRGSDENERYYSILVCCMQAGKLK